MAPEDSARSRWWHDPAKRRLVRAVTAAVAAAVPVALVNVTAFIGQFAFLHQHVPWHVPGQVLIAVAIESIAIYLSWHAHLATMANDSAMRLKLGAYSVALVVGAMNYSHYASHWRPTVMAVIMAMASALSPWLWGVHSRRASRDQLMERGLIEEHAVRLGATRWAWHAIRSFRVTYWATWHGENSPARAIAHFSGRYGTADTPTPARHAEAAQLMVAVPDVVAPAGAPAPDVPAAILPGTRVSEVSPGTTINGEPAAQLEGEASLKADATLNGGRPSQQKIDEVTEYLFGLSDDDVPSNREIARMLSDTSDQRRLAKRLRDGRMASQAPKEAAPARESIPDPAQSPNHRANGPQWIARPERYGPGGMNG